MKSYLIRVLFFGLISSAQEEFAVIINTIPSGAKVQCDNDFQVNQLTPFISHAKPGTYHCMAVKEEMREDFDFQIINGSVSIDVAFEHEPDVHRKRKMVVKYSPRLPPLPLKQNKVTLKSVEELITTHEVDEETTGWSFFYGLVVGFSVCLLGFQGFRKFRQQSKPKKEIYSPEDLRSEEKVSFLLGKLGWVRRCQVNSNTFNKILTPSKINLDGDYTVHLEFSDYKIHIHSSRIQNGYIIELATDEKGQQRARYLEDLATNVVTGLPSIFRAELDIQDYEQVKQKIKEIANG